MYTATIRRDEDADDLLRVFASEDKDFPNDRASYDVTVVEDSLAITLEAADTKALKALTNSITTVLDIYDKSERITGP